MGTGHLFDNEAPPRRKQVRTGREKGFDPAAFAAKKIPRHLVRKLLGRVADELELNRGVFKIVYGPTFEMTLLEADVRAALEAIRSAEFEVYYKRKLARARREGRDL
jgi:hypothetical protein